MGKFEVTKDQFHAFSAESSSHGAGGPQLLTSKCVTDEHGERKERTNRSFSDPGFKQSGNEPAVCVSWLEAKAYTAWLSKKTGKAIAYSRKRNGNMLPAPGRRRPSRQARPLPPTKLISTLTARATSLEQIVTGENGRGGQLSCEPISALRHAR